MLKTLWRSRWSVLSKRCNSTTASTHTNTITVDDKEINFFKNLTNKWWTDNQELKPLHLMNQLRVPFVRDGLINTGVVKEENIDSCYPLKNLNILDVGCGGGILTEALARLGGNITGLDASPDFIKVAQLHATLDTTLSNLSYTSSAIEDFCKLNGEQFDAVVASEVIEHVTEKQHFLKSCVKCLKPGGSIFITTFNKTLASNVFGIWIAEYLMGLAPKGAHTWDKFIPPHQIQRFLEDNNCRTRLVHGTFYNPFTCQWSWISNTSVHYALHAIKYSK